MFLGIAPGGLLALLAYVRRLHVVGRDADVNVHATTAMACLHRKLYTAQRCLETMDTPFGLLRRIADVNLQPLQSTRTSSNLQQLQQQRYQQHKAAAVVLQCVYTIGFPPIALVYSEARSIASGCLLLPAPDLRLSPLEETAAEQRLPSCAQLLQQAQLLYQALAKTKSTRYQLQCARLGGIHPPLKQA